MMMEWPDVITAKLEKKHELVIFGETYSRLIQESGIDDAIFSLISLNYLSITQTCLGELSDEIGNLSNLSTLVLHSNKLSEIPASIGKLRKLKVLDLSHNQLNEFPVEICELSQLVSLNLASNCIVSLPSFEQNVKLGHLDVSHNRLEGFPDVCHSHLNCLAVINLTGNLIKEVPSAIAVLGSLKTLNLTDNCLKVIPAEISDSPKLKELVLKGNKLTDKRLTKLVDQCHYKQVLDYIRQHCPRTMESDSFVGKSKKGKKSRKGESSNSLSEKKNGLYHKIKVHHFVESTPSVRFMDAVKVVRGHIICCILKNVSFTEDTLKSFIQIQNKLHDGICKKRSESTIATHDMSKIPEGCLIYTAVPPEKLHICPLMKDKLVTGAQLFAQLQSEAEAIREEKKRSAYSGVHRYLYLLEGKALYPCLLNANKKVISFPPITNSDNTKLCLTTRDVLVEVTSASSQTSCKIAMEALLEEALLLGIGDSSDEPLNETTTQFHTLSVEQVKIVDYEGQLKSVYPSRADLNFEGKKICVVRD